MADTPLSLRKTHSGTAYVDGRLTASDWDNSALLDGGRGVLVWGTDDVERAQALADAAVRHYFGSGLTARPQLGPTRWRLFCTSEDRDELEYRPAPDAAEPSVLFTAEEVADA
ncbi:hypothetical protein GCM10027258_62870 [Amycolatopsis stemonae]